MSKLKENLLERKRKKIEKKVLLDLKRKGGAESAFKSFEFKPTDEQVAQMVSYSSFGGHANVLLLGGENFFLEYILDEFHLFVEDIKNGKLTILDHGEPGIGGLYSQFETFGNILTYFEVDEKLGPEVGKISVDELVELGEEYPGILVDKESKSFGFYLSAYSMAKNLDAISGFWRNGISSGAFAEPLWEKYPVPKREFFPHGICEYTSSQHILFGTVDKLLRSIPDREKHAVRSHERQLVSGHYTRVKSHKRRNPLRLKHGDLSAVDHLVYKVFDSDSNLRYIGEGKSDRPSHVNSGTSHNYKINEHFFRDGEMRIEIVYEGLTKYEALSIEKFLLKQYSETELWNIKDYEPNGNPFSSVVDVESTIREFLD